MKALRGVATLFRHGEYSTITEIAGGREHEDGLSGEDMDTTGGVSQQTTDSELVSEATEVVQDIPSRQVDTVIQTVASASSLESTQVCADPPDSGTGDEQLGTGGDEFGSVGNETYTGGDEMEEDPTSIATDAEQASFQSETPHEKDDHGSTLTLANVTDDFQIMSPPKSKGRPKQQPRTVKAKRNQAIAMVQEDLGMHELQMSLLTVYELLDGEPNYKLTHEKLQQFKEFVFANKLKSPIAHEITKLPLTKPLTRPEEVVRIFPKQLINKCTSKVTAYQAKKGTLEMHAHAKVANSSKIRQEDQRALTWIDRLDFTRHGNSSFYVEEDSTIPTLLEGLSILSSEYVDMVDLAAKETLSAQVMQMILHKLFGADPSVRVIDPSNLGISNEAITTDSVHFKRALAGTTKKMKVLFPINCNNNHWCVVLMNLEKGRVYVYDSMTSSYATTIRAVAQQMITMLPDGVRPSARLVTHDPGLGVQSDSYNCGVCVLLAFEMFCGPEPLGHLDKKTLQCMRYRYLRMCMNEERSSSS
ncbi:uncharacterized protein IUM83_02995 [Phytophthora cinnamomi]|uniref:uncharacterized protein n=1 Tax=Phytophthora cinnamomi TaxID=4785 RepID=UPI00355A7851|nr:hypothetical protein IUM83_02995 [Phytophthora cinnamomi]